MITSMAIQKTVCTASVAHNPFVLIVVQCDILRLFIYLLTAAAKHRVTPIYQPYHPTLTFMAAEKQAPFKFKKGLMQISTQLAKKKVE